MTLESHLGKFFIKVFRDELQLIISILLLLKEPLGVGTVANVLIIGLVVDLALIFLGDKSNTVLRIFATFFGPIFVGLGSGFYIGTNLGPGPRDGLMTALNRRGFGGTIGWGTIWFLFSVGPSVQFFLKRLKIDN